MFAADKFQSRKRDGNGSEVDQKQGIKGRKWGSMTVVSSVSDHVTSHLQIGSDPTAEPLAGKMNVAFIQGSGQSPEAAFLGP